MTIVYFLILLSVIICIHELGHLIAAKIFGVYCFEFSFGMGKSLFTYQGKETKYSIRLLPIGGYVAMAGETELDDTYGDVEIPVGRRIIDIARWKRIIIMLAGVFMNFVLAVLIFGIFNLNTGYYAKPALAKIAGIIENSSAASSGLKAGDQIIKVSDDKTSSKVKTVLDMQIFMEQSNSDHYTLTIQRDQEVFDVAVQPTYIAGYDTKMIGLEYESPELIKTNFLNCWYFGILQMWMITKLMLHTIVQLFTGVGLNQLSGPVGIYTATKQSVEMGFSAYLLLIGQLSLNVGIFNLLPLPVLDGGQVVITIIEGLFRKTLSEKIKLAIMGVCWALLIAMIVFVTWNDIVRLIK